MKRFLPLLITCVLSSGCISDHEEPEWSLSAGDILPDFSVVTTEGRRVSASDSYTSPMVIIFFNTGCKDCREELPVIQKEYEQNLQLPADEQSQYICISREEGEGDVRKFWEEYNLTLPVSAQNDRHVYSMFASSGIPRIYKAREGVITYTFP